MQLFYGFRSLETWFNGGFVFIDLTYEELK
jgi:hypothetical protein